MDKPVQLFTGHGRLWPWQMAIMLLLDSFLRVLFHPLLLELISVVLVVLQAVAVVGQEFMSRVPLLVVLG